jgi:hypothetical protein
MSRIKVVRRVLVAAALVLAAAGAVAPAPPAGAADTAPDLGDFRLRRGPNELQSRVEALDARLPRLGVQNLLLQANRQARFGGLFDPCNEAAFNGRGIEPLHWCFDDADTGTVGGDQGSGNVEWMPQGVTTVADAQADERWGDRQAVLVSWYDKRLGDEKGVRVSFLDPETGLYQHVLLVYPYVAENEDPTYEILQTPQNGDRPGIHAGGIAWYGNYLYVADTVRGIRVFDMRYIFDLETAGNGNTTDRHQIGLHGGNYYGFGYRYVMPQVDLWVNADGHNTNVDFDCAPEGPPAFSYVGLDRSTAPDRLVTGEYCRNTSDRDDKNGRVATWPLDGDTGRPQLAADGLWHANAAHRLPVPNIQGAVVHDGTWYLSRSRGDDQNGHLVEARGDGSSNAVLDVTRTRWAGVGVEDLSYWPSQDAIWTVTEHPGKRALYSCPATAPPNRAGMVCGTLD